MQKKVFAILLAVLMLLTALPTFAASAVSSDAECFNSPDGKHHYIARVTKQPTCTEPGTAVYHCQYCRDEYAGTIPALGHDWGEWTGKMPTCTEGSYRTRVCLRDPSHVEYQILSALGHNFGEWYVVKAPTETEEGIEEHKCTRCGLTEQRPSPPLGQPDPVPNPDPDPDPVPKEEYALTMFVTQVDPVGDVFSIDEILDYDHGGLFLTYNASVMNTGKNAVYFREFNVGPDEWLWTLETPVLLQPGESYPFEIRRIVLDWHIIDGSASEKYDGLIEYNYYAYGETEDAERVCKSNEIPFQYHIASGFTDWTPDPSEVSIVKAVVSESADPMGYQLGEWITYEITVRNTGTVDIKDIDLYDSLLGSEPIATIDELLVGEPGKTISGIQYQVTPNDIINGYVSNEALAVWIDPVTGEEQHYGSLPVVVPTIPKTDLLVTKMVLNAPPDGRMFFTEGDEIIYQITVQNNSPSHLTDVWVTDPLIPTEDETGRLKHYDDLGPGEGDTFDYPYTVTLWDCVFEDLTNIAYVTGFDELGIGQVYPSNPVTVPTRAISDPPFGVISDLAITKEVTNLPKEGDFFTEGETIEYEITVENTGETVIEEGVVTDSLKAENGGELGSFENLAPMDKRTYKFSHVVTAQDVHDLEVVNTAYCVYHYPGSMNYYAKSTVRSKTGGDITGEVTPPSPGKETHCERVLTGKGPMAATYTLTYCPDHAEVAQEVAALIAEAENTSEAALLEAWTKAQALWKQEADELYEEALALASSERKSALAEDRIAQYAYLEGMPAMLTGTYGVEPYRAAQLCAEAWMNLCADLCDLMNTAPEVRKNSVYSPHETLTETADLESCGHVVTEVKEDGAVYAELMCTEHASVEAAAQKLVSEATGIAAQERAWRRVQSLWLAVLNRETNARYKAAEETARADIVLVRKQFDQMIGARLALLNLLYEARPAYAAEQIAQMLSDQVITVCALNH